MYFVGVLVIDVRGDRVGPDARHRPVGIGPTGVWEQGIGIYKGPSGSWESLWTPPKDMAAEQGEPLDKCPGPVFRSFWRDMGANNQEPEWYRGAKETK